MRTCIYGAGSLGTVLGAYLAASGIEVDLVSRNRGHVEGLRRGGARILGTVSMTVPVRAFLPEEMEGSYDLILLMTKQQDNPRVVAGLASRLSPEGVLCTFQNGIPEAGIAAILGPERTLGCAVAWGATLLGDGACELTSDPAHLSFSLLAGPQVAPAAVGAVRDLLSRMGPVTVEANLLGARWSKLLVNAAFSGSSAVLGTTFGGAAEDPASRRLVQGLIKECLDVAGAAGVAFEPIQGKDVRLLFDYRGPLRRRLSFLLIPLAIKRHRLLKASLLQDLEAGRKTEVEAINGVVADWGRRHGVPTPLNDLVVDLVHRIEAGDLRPGAANLALFPLA